MRDSLFSLLSDSISLPARLGVGTVVTLAFAALARWLRGVTLSGAIAGALACLAIYVGAGSWGFLALVAVFALTWLATRFGYECKLRLGTAEKREGRTASQVLANVGIAGFCAAAAATGWNRTLFLAACAAALAEAAADTVSSEIGQVSGETPRLITTLEKVSAGTDGGVSITGSLAGAIAALTVSLVFAPANTLDFPFLLVPAAAGFLGMLVDSFLGAWLERRKILGNNFVNLLSTSVAALISAFLISLLVSK
jgi:uncharacterized protein (TIGR00297 family)